MKSYAQILRENSADVLAMRFAGVSAPDIANKYNVSKWAVKDYCRRNGVKDHVSKNSEEEAAERIKEKTNGLFEYVSGYTRKEGTVRVRCGVCGNEFEKTYHHITTHFTGCPACKEIEREKKLANIAAIKKQKQEQRAALAKKRQEERENKRKEIETPHACPVCGELTTRRKYCSNACAKKANNASHEVHRRKKVQAAVKDKDISLRRLYNRDFGVCKICGGVCDWDDYKRIDGAFVVGMTYPSIDHVVPLSKGGAHAWDNVQLAHFICNTRKRDYI